MPRLPRFLAIAIAAVCIAVGGCTPSGDATTTTSTPNSTLPLITTTTLAPHPSVAIGIQDANYNLNPLSGNDSASQRVVGNAVWATVYDIDPDTWERIPDVVLALPSQTQGGIELHEDGSMTVQYQVHPNARWSDGIQISGADIAFTAETMRDLALAGSPAVDPVMAKVTEVDSAQNVGWITFSEQSLAFEEAFWVILPSHAVDDIDIATSDGFDWPSGGPFVGEPGDRGAELTANPFYWKVDDEGSQLPRIDSVTFVPYLSTLGEMFNARDIDVVELEGPATESSIDQSRNGVEIQEVPSTVLEHLTFNFRDSRAEANPNSLNTIKPFREAIAQSIDPAIYSGNELVYFEEGPPGVLTPRDGSAWTRYPFDSSAAEDLIDGLDVTNPSSVVNTTGNGELRIDIADALVPSFADSGVDLTPEFVDSVVFFGDILPGSTFDIGMWAWISDGGYQSTMALLDLFDPSGESDGYNGWGEGDEANESTARFSEIASEARSVTSTESFDALIAEAESILSDDLPILPLFQRASYLALWADQISGVRHNATRSRFTWNIEEWEAEIR
jgi:ABC-type transport system substrate-binding protein